MPILWQLAPLSRENLLFEVRGLQKCTQNRAKTDSKKTSQKNIQKIDFGIHFGSPKATEIAPKSTRIVSKADLKTGQLRDAMDLGRTSPEVNQPWRLETVSLATHMIRSGWSATRRPNHQHRFLRRSCCSTRAKGQVWASHRDCSENLQVSDAFRAKIHQIWPLEPSKFQKNRCQRHCQSKAPSKTIKKYGFYRNLTSFGTPNWSRKSWKFASKTRSKKQ